MHLKHFQTDLHFKNVVEKLDKKKTDLYLFIYFKFFWMNKFYRKNMFKRFS